MKRSLLVIPALSLLLALFFGGTTAQAGPKTCVPKGAKIAWHKYGVRAYFRKTKWYACANRYDKRFRLEAAEFESDSFSGFQTNGRYLFYVRSFVGATKNFGSIGRLLDLKTGYSSKTLGTRDVDFSHIPECVPETVHCQREVGGAAIGPGRSFVIGYRLRMFSNDGVTETYSVERQCFDKPLKTRTIQQLGFVATLAELASIKSVNGQYAQWSSAGANKTASFSCDAA